MIRSRIYLSLRLPILLLIISIFWSCKEDKKAEKIRPLKNETVDSLSFATGFQIKNYEQYKVLEIFNPWPKAEETYRYALIPEENLATITLNKDEYDAILTTPIKKIVVTSTTHIPSLELLDEVESLVGFPGSTYISSVNTRKRIDEGKIRELGKNEGINTEVLLELRPEVVVGFGIDGNNRTFETIKKSGIPVIYNGDWIETSPLAKAEWIKFFGALYQKEAMADSIFNKIKSEYNQAKTLASNIKNRPTILSGALEKDVWYLPSGTSPEAQLMKDANVDYLWSEVSSSGSLALSFEAVFSKAQNADIWLSPSYYNSMEALKNANEHYTQFKAFQNNAIFSFANTLGPTGGVTYYEEGFARPDLVLKDIIKICHPDMLIDYQPHFFKKLE